MKKVLLAILIFCSVPAIAQKYDIYLCIGQSNMSGRGAMLPEDKNPLEGVMLLGPEDTPVPACAPLNQYSTIRKKLSIQGINPAWSFGRKMHKESGRPVLLVVNAKGGTSIRLWTPNAPCDTFRTRQGDDPEINGQVTPQFYSEAVRRTRQAMKYGTLKGIIWHQGEGDSNTYRNPDIYMCSLAYMVKHLRKDLGADVPFIVGEIYRGNKASRLNPVLNRVGEYIPNSCCVSSEGLEANKDNVHFSREGQIELGERYADAILRKLYRKATARK